MHASARQHKRTRPGMHKEFSAFIMNCINERTHDIHRKLYKCTESTSNEVFKAPEIKCLPQE